MDTKKVSAETKTNMAPAAKAPKVKKLSRPAQRKAWITQGLCGIDGKDKIWAGHSTAECRKHFLYFKAKAEEARAKQAAPAKAKTRATVKAKPGKESAIPADMIDQIARSVAHKIGGDATVQLQPMTRSEMFDAIRSGVQAVTRQIGFRPPSA